MLPISIVIPMYNEVDNVEPFLNEVVRVMADYPDYEIIVIDDGSTDTTLASLLLLSADIPQLQIKQHRRNLGQSVGILTGVKNATKPWIVTLDGDGQNDPADIFKLIAAATKEKSSLPLLCAGNRLQRKDSAWKRFGSRFANSIRSRILQDDCPDTGCGIKLFPRDIFLTLPHFNHFHRYLPALFQRAGGMVINVPVNHRPRMQGKSKYGNWGRLMVGITDLLGVAWLMRRPCISDVKEKP